jgi:hypothetical protein
MAALWGHHFGTRGACRSLLAERYFIYRVDGGVVKRGVGGRRVMMDMCRAEALSGTVVAPMAGLPRSML